MTSAVIVSTARTPLAKSWKGAFNMTHGATLGGHAVKAAVEIGNQIPIAAFAAVAEILVYIYRANRIQPPPSQSTGATP